MTKELEQLINAILADGIITEKERQVLHKRAAQEGISADEIDVLVDGQLYQMRNRQGLTPPPMNQAPKQNRTENYGVVRKCPNCGNHIPAGSMQCDACGYAVTGVGFNNSVQQLSKLINDQIGKRNNPERLADIVQNFPVPSTKEDLLEFIFFTKSKSRAKSEDENAKLALAYRKKYYECIDKAKFYYPNDPQFQGLFREHEVYKREFWKNLNPETRTTLGGFALWIGVMLLCLILMSILSL